MRSKGGREKRKREIVGKVICILQLIISIVFVVILFMSNLLPMRYMLAVVAILVGLFGFCFTWQFAGKGVRIFSAFISILISICLVVGCVYIRKANQLMEDVGGASYKTDNMIVVVKIDDPAESLEDAKDYSFGTQTSLDQKNNELMIEDVKAQIGQELTLVEHATIQEEAQALLDGEVGAAIYNEAFTGLIEETIEGYSDQVRILYQYGIDTLLEEEEASVREPFNVYISGIDVSGAISTNSRSDVNIIMTVNPDTKQILLTTTPRDYYVELPGVSGGQKDKLTHAGIYGVDVSMATLEQLYDTNISYYARVNFTSLVTIVDALGGIDVESEYEFTIGEYSFSQGTNHLDGEAALAFSRARKNFASGDRQRGKNQEAVLTAILKKAMSPAILMNANKIIASVSDCVETNMTKDEMTEFINMQLEDPSMYSIESQAADGAGATQKCYSSGDSLLYVMYSDEVLLEQLKEKMQSVLATE
ncbi:MAG: LCP family protein [Dorea sp.]